MAGSVCRICGAVMQPKVRRCFQCGARKRRLGLRCIVWLAIAAGGAFFLQGTWIVKKPMLHDGARENVENAAEGVLDMGVVLPVADLPERNERPPDDRSDPPRGRVTAREGSGVPTIEPSVSATIDQAATMSFTPPGVGQTVSVQLRTGVIWVGVLKSLSACELEIVKDTMTLGLSRDQLSEETRVLFFAEDFIAAKTRKTPERPVASVATPSSRSISEKPAGTIQPKRNEKDIGDVFMDAFR